MRGIRISLALALLPLVAGVGCATVQRAREAQRGGRAPAGERTLSASEVGLDARSELTVDEAVRIALAYHPSITEATQNLAVAAAQLRQTQAGRRPSVGASAGYSRATANVEGGTASHDSSDAYELGLGLELLLLDFGRTSASVQQATARLVAAEEALRSARNKVAYAIRSAFFSMGKAQELRQVAEEAVRQYRAHLEQVKAFVDVGRRTRYDATKAEVDLGNAELSLINAHNDVRSARAALNRSLGLAENPGFPIAACPLQEFTADVEALMAAARRRHPELRALKAREAMASAVVDAAVADLYPSLGLEAQYALGGSRLPLTWNWSAGLSSALGLFSGGQKRAAIDQAVAELRAARARLADGEQQVYLELSRAASQLDSARSRLALAELLVRHARENLELADERYRVGGASSVELTDAQVALTGARAEQVKARFDCLAAQAGIRYAVGDEAP